jgi:hypothetical protein
MVACFLDLRGRRYPGPVHGYIMTEGGNRFEAGNGCAELNDRVRATHMPQKNRRTCRWINVSWPPAAKPVAAHTGCAPGRMPRRTRTVRLLAAGPGLDANRGSGPEHPPATRSERTSRSVRNPETTETRKPLVDAPPLCTVDRVLKSGLPNEHHLDEHIQQLLGRRESRHGASRLWDRNVGWRSLPGPSQIGETVPWPTLKALGDLNIDLDLDLFPAGASETQTE